MGSIKHKKGAADAKRGKLFSKLSRAIIVAAKEPGRTPAANLALQNAIEKARSYSDAQGQHRACDEEEPPPADAEAGFRWSCTRATARRGVAVLVEALTDNRNRTASEVRHLFTKHGGNLGATGAVAWQFERRGLVLVAAEGADEEELLLAAAAGADDVSLDGSTFRRCRALPSPSPRSGGARGGRLRGRVGRALDGCEDDRRDREPSRPRGRCFASSKGSRKRTTSRTST